MNIDADSHFTPREIYSNIPKELKDAPQLVVDGRGQEKIWYHGDNSFIPFGERSYSIKLRLDAMKEAGFDKQCLLMSSGTIPDFFSNIATSIHFTRAWNDAVSKLSEKHDCFVGIAQIPRMDVDAAVEEARRCIKDLGFRAIQIVGSWGPKNIESLEWWPFFSEVEKLGVPLWHHGMVGYAYRKFNPYAAGHEHLAKLPGVPAVFLSFLWQAQLVSSGLIFGGVLDKFPSIKVVLTECDAGWVPSFMDWLDMIYLNQIMYAREGSLDYYDINPLMDGEVRKKPSQYLRNNFYFVLTNTHGYTMNTLLPMLVNKVNLQGNLMIESDFDHAEGSLDIVNQIHKLQDIDEDAKDRICGKNAADLLKLPWAPSTYDPMHPQQ